MTDSGEHGHRKDQGMQTPQDLGYTLWRVLIHQSEYGAVKLHSSSLTSVG